MIYKKFCCLFSAALLCLACSAEPKNEKTDIFLEKVSADESGGGKITVELALTQEQKTYGFMKRKIIPEGTGMIFVYKEDEKMRFWMKDTLHPLSIAFIDASGIIREIFDMAPYSLQVTASTYFVRYALEVPQGMFARMGIQAGDKLSKDSLMLLKRKAVE